MKNLLAPGNRPLLRRLAQTRALLAFDFDGTLAPIVANPARAQLRLRTKKLLQALARLCPCVVISGRARADVMGRLVGIPLRQVYGNHGIEPSPAMAAARRNVRRWLARLVPRLEGLHGVVFEDKGASLALHYRKARDRSAARRLILEAVGDLPEARVMEGILVVDLLPPRAPSKATALQAEMRRLRCEAALYVGDDQTDEDIFALSRRLPLLAVRVGRAPHSLAPHYLAGQNDINALLAALLSAAKAVHPSRPKS
jgi:trehalose 6-phosphate phosphatase